MCEDEISYPTVNDDNKPMSSTHVADSIFAIDEDFDPSKACKKLLIRESASEKYVIDKQIAQGAMGAIYRVFDRDLKRTTVLKVMLPHIMESRQMFITFIGEARITGQLEHPNIIPVHDLGVLVQEEKLYFSMKYIEGEALNTILKKIQDSEENYQEKYSIYSLLMIFRKVCDAMAYAHSKDIIHRDLKPENIMVGNYGEVLVVDWGLARRLSDPEPEIDLSESQAIDIDPLADTISDRTATRLGDIKGTPAYMPPEMAKGDANDVDHRSDIFLLGATLYAMSTLSAPYCGDDIIDIIESAQAGDFEHPQERAPHRELPIELCRIITRAMAYDREDRYQTVDELNEDIDDLLEGRTASEQRFFEPGDLLMEEGDTGNEAYVIITGEVEVFKTIDGNAIPLINLRDGDCIGEMAMISDAPRSASVRAITETQVVVITEDLVTRGLDKLPPWMGNVVTALVERLRATNANVHPLINSNCAYHVLTQLLTTYLCWGRPSREDESAQICITLDVEKTIREIALNLSIAIERVAETIAKVNDSGIISAYDEDHLHIPDLTLYCQFLAYLRVELNIENQFQDPPKISLFANRHEFVISHGLEPQGDSPADLETIEPYQPGEFSNCQTPEDNIAVFEQVLQHLQEKPTPTLTVSEESAEEEEGSDE